MKHITMKDFLGGLLFFGMLIALLSPWSCICGLVK